MLPDDEALLVTTDEPHRLTIERIALTDGRRLGQWTGEPEGCRVPVALRPGRAMVFGLVDGALVSVPPAMTGEAVPCRWELRDDATMAPTRLPELAIPDQTVAARLVGDRVVRHDRATTLAVLSLSGETLLTDRTAAGRLEAVTADATADLMLTRIRRATQLRPDFRLLAPAVGWAANLPELGASAWAGGCSLTLPERLALSPDGRLAALGCAGHVQIWLLSDDDVAPALVSVLPAPPGFPAARLAFSPDGSRLVLGPQGVAVWRTADWSLQAFVPGPEEPVFDKPPVLALTRDGGGVATTTGYWEVGPAPAGPAG